MRLTKSQEGILNAEAVIGGAISNICGATFFPHAYGIESINNAVNTVVRINDAIRLRIDVQTKTQWVSQFQWKEYEVLRFANRESFDQFAETYAKIPLSTDGALYDAKIFTIGERQGIIYILHHAICDAWCFSVLRWQLYQILEKGVVPPAYSFLNHLSKLETYYSSRRFSNDRAYFLGQYEEYKDRLMPLNHVERDYTAHSLTMEIAPELSSRIRTFAEKNTVSEYVLFLTAFGLCYSKINGYPECFYLGTTILNRTTEEELHTIGTYMDDIPLLFHVDYDAAVEKAIADVEERIMNSFRHHRFNYPMLQEAIRTQTPDVRLYDAVFNYQSEYQVVDAFQVVWYHNGIQNESLQIHVDHRNDAEKRMVTYNYLDGRFSERDILQLHTHFMTVLSEMISDKTQPVRAVNVLSAQEKERLLSMSMGAPGPLPVKSVYQLFEEQTRGKITEGEREYSLADLKRDAEKVDAAVRGKKRVIGVLCERSYAELAAIYGIVRGGNAYLPIDPDNPEERIERMLSQSGCDLVLAQRKYLDRVPNAIAIEDILDGPMPDIVRPCAAAPDDALYVIFTSGSTGAPKGAAISNRSAVNRVDWMIRRYFDADTVVMLKTPYTFDVSVWEIFGFALGGFSLYILPPEEHYRQDKVAEHIRKGCVTDLHFVPTIFGLFLEAIQKSGIEMPSLKNVFLSGEALSAALVNASPAPVHNLYGPTECTVDVSYYDCSEQETDPVPIGRPVDLCRLYVLDKFLQPLPIGATGQICIGGINVGLGYINDPDRTDAAFVPDPFGEGKMYLTGDLGYWREDGNLIYVGRTDHQVKINGQRIELGEIEAAMSCLVPAAAVLAEDNRLIAFYTGDERSELRTELSRSLPRHMIPHSFVHLEQMPLTASGKVNRRALAALPQMSPETSVLPKTAQEQLLASAVKHTLSLPDVSMSNNFYEIGGDSLSSIYVITYLRERGYDLTITDFLNSQTLADAAKKMTASASEPQGRVTGTAPAPPMVRAFFREAPVDPGSFTQTCVIPVEADEIAVRNALDAIIAQHDMLRATFPDDAHFSIGSGTYSFRTEAGPEREEDISFNLRTGPLVDAILYPGLLKLTIHHFVVDAVSWRIILNDLTLALRGEALPPKTSPYLEWAKAQESETSSLATDTPVAYPEVPSTGEERFRFEYDAKRLSDANRFERSQMNAFALAALGLAANHLAGQQTEICVEMHGRMDPRFHRTVGWFTAVSPATISGDGVSALESAVGQLRSISAEDNDYVSEHGTLPPKADILFNFFRVDPTVSLGRLPIFPGKINVNCTLRSDRLLTEISVSDGRYPPGITKKLAEAMCENLDSLAEACEGLTVPGGKLFDYTDEKLTVPELEEICRSFDVEDVFSPTPTQMGMLRQTNLKDYHLQYVLRLHDAADAGRVRTAFHKLADRHSILRSAFVRLQNGKTKQVIVHGRYPLFQVASAAPETVIRQDFERNFDLSGEPLLRVTAVEDLLVISAHHLILDGWSLSVLAQDLQKLIEDPDVPVEQAPSFSVYAQWRGKQPDSLGYWWSLLRGCGISSDLPHEKSVLTASGTCDFIESTIHAEGVFEYARDHRVSVNTVLETAFARYLLQFADEALFGKIISGRNAPVAGVEKIVGPLINLVPVYVKSGEDILARIHAQSVQTNTYGFISLEDLYLRTDLKRINILFINENYPVNVSGLELISYSEQTQFDLTVTVRQTPEGYVVRASYAPVKYARGVIEALLSGFEDALRGLLQGDDAAHPATKKPKNYVPPVNALEREICDRFEEVTGAVLVGRDDSFYDLGGTSLGMMTLLSRSPLEGLSPSDFMVMLTPAALAERLNSRDREALLVPLYTPDGAEKGIVLFSYGGGDAAAYTALVSEFRIRQASVALYYVPWLVDYDAAASELRRLSEKLDLHFYSHCAGAVVAMKLLDQLNAREDIIRSYIAGASIPPDSTDNPWPDVDDGMITAILHKAGMPALPPEKNTELISRFRSNTEEYFSYLKEKTEKTPCTVCVLISREDLFTKDDLFAKEKWERYVRQVDKVKVINSPTHYFQSTEAQLLADILLEE